MAELKPCPFCGGSAKIYYAPANLLNDIPCFGVCCERCNVMIGTVAANRTDFFRTANDAVDAWNRRTDDYGDQND